MTEDTLHAESLGELLNQLGEQMAADPEHVTTGHPAAIDLLRDIVAAADAGDKDAERGRRYHPPDWSPGSVDNYNCWYERARAWGIGGHSGYREEMQGVLDGFLDGLDHPAAGPVNPDWWHYPQPEPDNRTRDEEIEDIQARLDELEAGGS